jgi:Ni/Co efflux regulator RcnB
VRHDRYRAGAYHRPHGYRSYHWYAGARLPAAYYAPRYVIYDYPAYRLRPPPYGYHWVRVDNDVVLAAIATGVVLQVVNEIFW